MSSDWKLVADCFGMDFRDSLIEILPDLEVDTAKLRVAPTAADPLARGSRLMVHQTYDHQRHQVLLSFEVDKRGTPYLATNAIRAYVLIEWPNLFRVRTRPWNQRETIFTALPSTQ